LIARAGERCRAGELLRRPKTDEGVGDFGRLAAEAKGEELDAKASKPVRFKLDSREGELEISDESDEEPRIGVGLEIALGVVLELELELAHGDGLAEKRLGPVTFANGELVDA
jgi:hypothetical protein